MPNLKALTIIDANLDTRVLTNLTTIAPSLADITLDTCVMSSDKNIWPVNMPHSSLDILTIKCDAPATKDDFDIHDMNDDFEDLYGDDVDKFEMCFKPGPRHLQMIRKHNMVLGNYAYLRLTLPNKSKFFRLSSDGSGVAISEDVFQSNYCRINPTFIFHFESLKVLRIRLGAFSVTLRFDENYNLKPQVV